MGRSLTVDRTLQKLFLRVRDSLLVVYVCLLSALVRTKCRTTDP